MKSIIFIFPALIAVAHSQLREPDTVFYGKVLHHGGGEPRLLTSGSLGWEISGPDGETFTAKATLESLDGGLYSYSVRLPRGIAVAGLPAHSAPAGLPVLADLTRRYRNAAITVDGHVARLADPSALEFPAGGEERARFVRADLIVDFPLPDADGDGMPDWWEEKYGLDPQLASATKDRDGDGISDLAEFHAGTDPLIASTAPQLAAEWRVTIPESGTAALIIKANDADTPPALLTYTLDSLPSAATVRVLGDRPVPVGGTFTQKEIDAGRVLISTTGPLHGVTAMISLADETHAPLTAGLLLGTATRAELLAAGSFADHALPDGLVLHDANVSPVAVTLRAPTAAEVPDDLPRLFIGSPLDDHLSGSAKADVLAGGVGNDTLTGGPGADRFIVTDLGGQDRLVDFSPEEGDVIDLSALLVPAPEKSLRDFVQYSNGVLGIDADGDGSGFTDALVHLPENLPDLAELWDAGHLDTGAISPRTAIFLTATDATEENLAAGSLQIRRRGDAALPLTVSLEVTGTAASGTDYVPLPSEVTFAAGQKLLSLPIIPLADSLRETMETLEFAVLPAPGFDLVVGTATAQLFDLPTRVWLEVIERVAFRDPIAPAQALLRRSGSLGSKLTVVLDLSGRATPVLDFLRLPTSFSFAVGQDTVPIEILPISTASLTYGAEDVILTIRNDETFLMGESPSARLVICDQPQTIADWREARMPGNSMSDEEFLAADLDHDGFDGLTEFALDLNPNGPDSPAKSETRVIFDAEGMPGLEFRRRPGALEVVTEVLWSPDLRDWRLLTATDSVESSVVIESDGLERVRQVLKTRPAGNKIHFLLKFRRP